MVIIIILCDNYVPLFSLICRLYFSFNLPCLFTSSFVDAFPLSTIYIIDLCFVSNVFLHLDHCHC